MSRKKSTNLINDAISSSESGSQNFEEFSNNLYTLLNIEDDVASKVISASESTAAIIVRKMMKYREHIPYNLINDFDWCVH